MRSRVSFAAVLALACSASDASALVWPDVPERVEKGLSAADPNTRRIAAHELASLGVNRGTPLVIRALNDPDDEVRLAAADSAIRLRVKEATDIVIPWLGVKDARAKKKACEVARALPNPRAVPPLARTLGDPDQEVRQAAADALGHSASPDAVAPLLGKLDDANPPVRIQIVGALARLGDVRAVVPLVGKVQDSSVDVRQAVSRALGELGDLRASQALLLQLRDNSNEVRKEAITALGRLRAPDAVDAIAPFLLERTPALRLAALVALGRIATKDAVRVLIGALGVGDDAGGGLDRTPVRDALVAAGPSAVPQLRVVIDGPASPHVATSAAWVIGELHAKSEAAAIVAAMRRGSLPAAAALHALAGAGGTDAVAIVLEFVGDPSPAVRGEALRAAQQLLDPSRPDGRAVEPLSAALRDTRPSAQERATIALLLGRTGAPRAASVLAELTNAREPALRLAAIDALGMLGPAGADDALLSKLTHVDAQVRLHAAVALGDAGSEKARDILLDKLDAGDEMDRSVVLTALGGILHRKPNDAAITKLSRALSLAAGPERDALLIAIGRAPSPAAVRVLADAARGDVDDRKTIATVLPASGAAAVALTVLRALLADTDASVRAQAAWSLGAVGDATDVAPLEALSRATDADVAIDATAAIGRIGARAKSGDVVARALCPRIGDARAHVRANALAGLALGGVRCGDGAAERRALAEDPSDEVRAAAALAIARSAVAQTDKEDKKALERCATGDHAGSVAHRCRLTPTLSAHSNAVEIYIVAEGASSPRAHAGYALEMADGLLHGGSADRRGAVFDPNAPDGDVMLRRAGAVAR